MSSIVALRHAPDETWGVIDGVLLQAGLAWHYVDLFDTVLDAIAQIHAFGRRILPRLVAMCIHRA